MFLFFFYFFFAEIGHIDFDVFDEADIFVKRAEEDHQVFSRNVHPVIIAEGKSFSDGNAFSFDYVLWVVRPYFINVLGLKICNIDVLEFRRLLIVILHPFPYSLVWMLFLKDLSILFFRLFDFWFFFVHIVVIFEFRSLVFSQLPTIPIDAWASVKRWIIEHLTEPFVYFYLCHLRTRSHELRIISGTSKPLVLNPFWTLLLGRMPWIRRLNGILLLYFFVFIWSRPLLLPWHPLLISLL